LNYKKIIAIASYEIKRAFSRKKVLALIILTVLIATVPYYLLKSANVPIFTPDQYGYLWVLGILVPNGFFIPFTALLIAAGSMSEEYEQGTAEILLSKPISRDEFISGKYLGGLVLLQIVVLINALLTLSSATLTFGEQSALEALPWTVGAQALSSIVFYSIAFLAGELVRRSSLSYIIASAVYFSSAIASIYLRVIYQVTFASWYQTVNYYLPTSAVSSLPVLVGQHFLPPPAISLMRLLGISAVENSISLSIVLIVVYSVISFLVARLYFVHADISKKIS
jgi:ABC-2 type transport system permease protein